MFVALYLALIVAANLLLTWLVPTFGVWICRTRRGVLTCEGPRRC